MFTNPAHLYAVHADHLERADAYRRTRLVKRARRAEHPSFARRFAARLRRIAYAPSR